MPGTQLGPSVVVPAPPLVAPSFGLVQTVQVIEPDDDRWLNGIVAQAAPCLPSDVAAGGRLLTLECDDDQPKPGADDRVTNDPYQPFAVTFTDECSTFGLGAGDYAQRARSGLLAYESHLIEREWWAGEKVTTNAHLDAATTPTLAGGAAVAKLVALRALVDAAADAGVRGVIHATPETVTSWSENGLVIRDPANPRRLTTLTGQTVVAGSGYLGTGPNGVAPGAGEAWAYVTDELQVYRQPAGAITVLGGDPRNNGAMSHFLPRNSPDDTGYTNRVITLAERFAAINWNGCLMAAVLVTL